MAAQISAYGRLVADPETRTTGKVRTWLWMAHLVVSLPCNAAEGSHYAEQCRRVRIC